MSDTPEQQRNLAIFKAKYHYRDDLDQFLDEHPCKHCGGHYDMHNYLTESEIADAREQGCIVEICESVGERTLGRGETFFTIVAPLPKDPCDTEFMEDISS